MSRSKLEASQTLNPTSIALLNLITKKKKDKVIISSKRKILNKCSKLKMPSHYRKLVLKSVKVRRRIKHSSKSVHLIALRIPQQEIKKKI